MLRGAGRDDVGERAGDLLDRQRLVDRGVGDAEAAAEVELGHRPAGEQFGVQREQPARGLGEAVGLEDLRSDVRVQAEERELGPGADRRDDGRRVGDRDAELLVLARGREVLVRRGVHARC